ncbi:Peroxisome biogenesis factor 1-like [Homarus americanus]|uniref:Peroxisomal ATPase PEX1 n=1 Tax=Homarus americanus TaxID=6706 RepID=A0A8J5KAM2_HOMAM|nr:Peroxisome biogenesis factor 1-like [Homarus americanus]
MQPGGFSRSVVVKEWAARHCFVSVPRHWAGMALPAPTPTFCLEASKGQTVMLSWAGDIHNPSIGNESTVLVSREVLKDCGINDGEDGVLTQVQVPPPCTTITVVVGSLTQWQDLALNAEVAPSAILSQVRVIGVGQSVPLWLEGGACVFLTVTSLDPPLKFGVLQPMTQVEVLPPVETDGSHDYTSINFTPTAVESLVNSEIMNIDHGEDWNWCNKPNVVNEDKKKNQGRNNCEENMYSMVLSYMCNKLNEQKAKSECPVKRDIRLGYRVVPMPDEQDSLPGESLPSHPSLIIISRESLLYTSYKNEINFIGCLKKINSPKEISENSSALREESKSSEKKKQDVTVRDDLHTTYLCTVIVWENFLKERNENIDFVEKMKKIMKRNICVVPNCLRRLMKLSTLSVIELQTSEFKFKTVPVSVDILPLTPVSDSKTKLLSESVKNLLKNLTDETPVIINQNTLLEVDLNGKTIDVFITTRDGVPLMLTNRSVVLLEITLLRHHSNLPYISSTISDLNKTFLSKFSYFGEADVFLKLKQHVLLGQGFLTDCCHAVPQFALLHGSKGLGKTSLVESLVECLSSYPYYIHSDIVSFKQLKGKKMETIEKKLQLVFREAIFKKPSIIVLDDMDHLVPSQGLLEQDSGPVYEHTMQMVSMLKGLLDQLIEFFSDEDSPLHLENPNTGTVMVIATCITRTSVHPLLVSPQGCHYFPCTFGIRPLNPEDRIMAFNNMLKAHIKMYKLRERLLSEDHGKDSLQDTDADQTCEPDKDSCSQYIQLDAKVITRRTESFVLPDLNHLALRTFLQAKHRWECKVNLRDGNFKNKKKGHEQNRVLFLPSSSNVIDYSVETSGPDSDAILTCDVEAALEGYTHLALRGLTLSEKKNAANVRVGGLAEASRTLEETLTWPSMYPNLFSKVKLRLRSGVLLYGPPGCGKTLLANSVTSNCQLNFISVKGPELLSKYIGASEEAVRDAFERASSAKPCVLFFDEFESIAPRRGHDSTGVTDRVVNQLLTQMDGVEGLTGVYILAATSRPDLIDPALLRPGRLDKCVFCPIPSLSDREEILQVLSDDIDLGEDIDWGEVAHVTENFTGADLQSLLSTAQVLVAQEALGDTLYEGVIPNDQLQEKQQLSNTVSSVNEQTEVIERTSSLELSNEENVVHGLGSDRYLSHTVQEEVIIEKEREKVTFSQKVVNLQENDELDIKNKDEYQENEVVQVIDPPEYTDGSSQSNVCCSKRSENLEFKVFKRHINAALKEVKPSVSLSDRLRYEQLYATFTKSKGGNFGQPSPGKRATLA